MDTRLFINTNGNYAEVDLYDDIDIPVTYNVADVRDISKKDSNWSLTVKIPNTQRNAQLFELNDDISRYNSTFEMLKQYPAFVEVGCNSTFEGYFKLTEVIINDNKEVVYEGNLYSNVLEFMKRLGTTTLRGNADPADDLSFSEYTFGTPERPFDADSWFRYTDMFYWDTAPDPDEPTGEKPYGKDCYFAVVDEMAIESNSNRYDVSTPNRRGINLFFDELTPFLFYKEIWDKLFKWAGFSYVSDFIENTANNTTGFEFDRLAYPAVNLTKKTNDKIYTRVIQTDTSLVGVPNSSRQFYWTQNTSLPYPLDEGVGYVDVYANPNNTLSIDEVENNSVFGVYYKTTINRGGIYHLDVNIPFNVWIMITDPTGHTDYTNLSTYVDMDTTVRYHTALEFVHKRGGSLTTIGEIIVDENYESQYYAAMGRFQLCENTLSFNRDIILEPNDELFIKYYYRIPVGGQKTQGGFTNYAWVAKRPDPSPEVEGSPLGLRNYVQFPKTEQNSLQIGLELVSDFTPTGIFDPTTILNPNRKKVDFINDIVKKFNLYIEDVTNKKDDNGVYYRDYTTPNVRRGEPILRIEPRNMFYNNHATVVNWTNRVDTNSIEFCRIDDYLYKRLIFNDKDDQTYFVKDYNEQNYTIGEYGEKIEVSPYNTNEDEKTEVKTDLGQTMVGRPFSKNNNNYLECPYIFSLNDSGELRGDKEFNDRMLFVFNLYSGSDPNNIYPWDFQNIWNNSNLQWWRFYKRNNLDLNSFTGTVYTMRSFCVLNHFNVPFGKDTADLNFGWANWYYQNLNGTWATSNNCYNVFYKQMIDDYNSPEARLMTCKMYLKSSDIRDLQLSDTILVNSVAYHINKIKQWKSEYEPVEVELIKIIQSTSKSNQPILKKNNPPKVEIVTLNTLKELIESQNKSISEMSKQVEILDGTIKKMDEQLIKLDERVKKLEGGGTETSEDGSNPDKDENNKDDYD